MGEPQRNIYLLDAGHAPDTAGKRSPELPDGRRLLEWQFSRDVVRRICRILDELDIAHHELTPHINEDIGPTARAELANELALEVELPAIVISVHSNAAKDRDEVQDGWSDANGVTVLYYPTSKAGLALAERFQAQIVAATGWRDRGVKGRSDLSILKKTHMPAILTENGFYTSREQCEQLLDDSVRETIALAHVAAIQELERESVA